MPGKYARNTEVPIAKSRAEVEEILMRYGADQFMYGNDGQRVMIGFRMPISDGSARMFRMILPLPKMDDREIVYTEAGQKRSPSNVKDAWDKACRSSWRAFCLVIKAKLEAAEVGISTVEREFLSDTVMTDNGAFGDMALPQIAQMYETGEPPRLLLGIEGGR